MRVRLLMPFRFAVVEADAVAAEGSGAGDAEAGLGAIDLAREREVPLGISAFSGIAGRIDLELDGGAAHLVVGKLGVAALVVEHEIADADGAMTAEEVTRQAASGRWADWARQCRQTYATTSTEPIGPALALWVHRLFVLDPEEGFGRPVVPLEYGKDIRLSRGARATIADGFSALWATDTDHIEAVLDGLFLASQTWIVHDDLARQALWLLDRADDSHPSHEDQIHALETTAAVALAARRLTAFARRQSYGLVDGRARTYSAAVEVWGMTDQLNSLIERADAYVEYVHLQASEVQESFDRRRNYLLFGLSFAAVAQTLIAAYEVLTGSTSAVGPTPRVVVFIVATIITLVGVTTGILYVLVDRSRRRHPRRHRGARPPRS